MESLEDEMANAEHRTLNIQRRNKKNPPFEVGSWKKHDPLGENRRASRLSWIMS